MRRRLCILMAILVVMIMAITLVACGSTNTDRYKGEPEIKFVFKEAYNNISVSCPSADIEYVDSKTVICKLKNTQPVQIYVTADDKDIQSFVYETKDLKRKNIVENVSLDVVHYEVTVHIGELPENYDGELSIVGKPNFKIDRVEDGIYKIIGTEKIREDVLIHLGDNYIDMPLRRKDILYRFGNIGDVTRRLVAVSRDGGMVAIGIDEYSGFPISVIDVNGDYQPIDSYEDNLVPIQDYYVKLGYGETSNAKKLPREKLEANRYYHVDEMLKDTLELRLEKEINEVSCYNPNVGCTISGMNVVMLYSLEPILAGEIIWFNINNNTFAYAITEEDLERGCADITNDKLVQDLDMDSYVNPFHRKAKFNLLDEDNKPISDSNMYLVTINGKEKIENGKIMDVPVGSISIEESGRGYVEKSAFDNLYIMMHSTEDEFINVNVFVPHRYNFDVVYYDVDTGDDVYTNHIERITNNTEVYLGCSGYVFADKNYYSRIIFDKDKHAGKTLRIGVRKQYNIRIKIDNFDLFNRITDKYNPYFRSDEDEMFGTNFNGHGTANLTVTKDMLGKKYTFFDNNGKAYGYARIWFDVVLPDNIDKETTVTVTLNVIEDEWM